MQALMDMYLTIQALFANSKTELAILSEISKNAFSSL